MSSAGARSELAVAGVGPCSTESTQSDAAREYASLESATLPVGARFFMTRRRTECPDLRSSTGERPRRDARAERRLRVRNLGPWRQRSVTGTADPWRRESSFASCHAGGLWPSSEGPSDLFRRGWPSQPPYGGSTRFYGGSTRRQGSSGLVRGGCGCGAGTSGQQREAVTMPAR
jgi:hypothetical protein